MLKRSISSGLLLSAAILSSGLLSTSLHAQPAPAPATPPAPAVKGDLKTLADDFIHYSRVNNTELAKANGEAILASGAKPADILKAFEDSTGGTGYREVMIQDLRRNELKETASKLLDTVDEGFRTVARDPVRIRREIDNLGNGPRAYVNSRDRLAAAGEFAVPIYLEYLQAPGKQEIRPFILRAMGEIGRPLLNPLIEVLRSNDQSLKIDIVNVLGQIGYPQALPMLRAMQNDEKSSVELKAAIDSAMIHIDSTGTAMKMSAADLYLSGARNYYAKRVSYQPTTPSEGTSPVWYFDQGLKNVTLVKVPTVIWNDVMTLRMTEAALRGDASNGAAIALWNAANLRRELELPKGEKDPTRTADALDASFYALAAGPQYMNPVLTLALDDHNDALALRAIDVLEKTGGISGLVASSDAPLVRALAHPNRAVRFHAAFALARANPSSQFSSFYRVVPILAEAVNSSSNPTVLLVVDSDEARNAASETLRNSDQHFVVYAGKTALAALDQAKNAPAFDLVIVPDDENRNNLRTLSRTDYRLQGTPVLVAVKGDDVDAAKIRVQSEKGVAVVDDKLTTESIVAGLKEARAESATAAMTADDASSYARESLAILGSLAADHKSIYNVGEAVPTLVDALKDKRPEIVDGSAHVLGQVNSPEGQQALAIAALSDNNAAASRVMFFDDLRENAKRTGNTLDASAINGIIKVVSTEKDAKLQTAAAGALGALNVSSNQSSALILKQAR